MHAVASGTLGHIESGVGALHQGLMGVARTVLSHPDAQSDRHPPPRATVESVPAQSR